LRSRLTLAALCCLLVTGVAQASAAAPLSHEGRWVTDRHGRVVILHGWNVVYKVGSYRPEDTGFGRDDARFLRRHGFNTVRLGVIYKGLEPRPPAADGKPRYRDGYLRSIERTQRLLARHGIHTLLDFHQDLYNERFQGEGWPDWQVLDDGLPSEPQIGFPGNYLVNVGLQRAFDNFWANEAVAGVGLQDRYARAWRHVARRFQDASHLLGYNILNEPWPGTGWEQCATPAGCPLFDTQKLEPFSERVIGAIRRVDRRSLVWYAPNVLFDFGSDSSHGDTGDPRAGFAFNMYCLAGGPTCGAGYGLTLDNAEEQSTETGDALLMTDFGATNDLDVLREIVELADERMMSWQQWHYCECDDPTTTGTGMQSIVADPHDPPRGDNLNRGKLKVSSRPYPRAVAGTPEGWSFDRSTGTFELAYSTATPAGGRLPRRRLTEVFLPRIHYREGYDVELTGARAVSKPGAKVLRLKRGRDAGQVQLTVTPG
jgi:endoglycosylceramidase